MLTISEQQQAIIEVFQGLPDWDARYKTLIDWGKALPAFPETDRTEKNIVRGCQSQVWMTARLDNNGLVQLQADSDALIVKGLIALIVKVYSGQPPADILANPPTFLETIELGKHLSMQRSNGLAAMMKQIQLYATVFQAQLQAKA